MITCGYCGRENEDGSVACAGCGTRREEEAILPPKSKGRRRWWVDLRLHYAGYALGVLLFYFLSFGPVMYFFSKVTTRTTGTAAGGTLTTSVTVELPGWVSIAYYPAFELYTADSTDQGYGRYVSWWLTRRTAK